MVDEEQIIDILKKVSDPEIQMDVWNLGLIYNIDLADNNVKILMTFTSPMCPYGPMLMDDIRRHVASVDGVKEVDIEITFSPAWGNDKISEEAKIALGIM